MAIPPKSEAEDQPLIVTQFYHSHVFPFLGQKYAREVWERLKTVPDGLRDRELAPHLLALGETSGDPA